MKKILIISPSEICHNPRLLKAADFFFEKGFDVTVWNCIIGVTTESFLKDFKSRKKYKIIDFDISKRNFISKINWVYVSIIYLIARLSFKFLKTKGLFYDYFLNKNLVGFSYNKPIDYIMINLVDSLPIASKLASRTKAILIYDSQEFFTGLYSNSSPIVKEWVCTSEKKFIYNCDIIFATTDLMASKLKEKYELKSNVIRVRNLPYTYKEFETKPLEKTKILKLVWHGFYIHLNSRGLNILLKSIIESDIPLLFTLQGNITQSEKEKIINFLSIHNALHKIQFKLPADPEKIVESLLEYDIGLIGELPLNENQLYTSSNKLFEYLHAGLAVVSSDMPGIKETIVESKAGLIYKAGNYIELKNILINLYNNNIELLNYKKNAKSYSRENYYKKDLEIALKIISS